MWIAVFSSLKGCVAFVVKPFSYAPLRIRQNSLLEKRGNCSNGGKGKCVVTHIKNTRGERWKNVEKIHLGRGHVCVEIKKHLRLYAGVLLLYLG